MSMRVALFMVTAGSLLVLTGPLRGQEVNSDVKIPPPRVFVTGAPAISGIHGDPGSRFTSDGQILRGSVAQAAAGTLSEGATREELGDFMTSLLLKAGIIAFDRPTDRLADFRESAKDGSRPAWTGPTPMTLSVSRTERSRAARRR